MLLLVSKEKLKTKINFLTVSKKRGYLNKAASLFFEINIKSTRKKQNKQLCDQNSADGYQRINGGIGLIRNVGIQVFGAKSQGGRISIRTTHDTHHLIKIEFKNKSAD